MFLTVMEEVASSLIINMAFNLGGMANSGEYLELNGNSYLASDYPFLNNSLSRSLLNGTHINLINTSQRISMGFNETKYPLASIGGEGKKKI